MTLVSHTWGADRVAAVFARNGAQEQVGRGADSEDKRQGAHCKRPGSSLGTSDGVRCVARTPSLPNRGDERQAIGERRKRTEYDLSKGTLNFVSIRAANLPPLSGCVVLCIIMGCTTWTLRSDLGLQPNVVWGSVPGRLWTGMLRMTLGSRQGVGQAGGC